MWAMANGIHFMEWYNHFSDPYRNPLKKKKKQTTSEAQGEDCLYKKIWRKRWSNLEDKEIPVKMDMILKIIKAQYPDFQEADYKKFNEGIIDILTI